MVAELLTGQEETRELARLLRAEPLADGTDPEERLVICGVSWERYLALDKALGDDRPGPRFYFLERELEIMTTSNEHERIKTWIGDLMAIYFEHTGTEVMPRGQATMRIALQESGAEPDESWCIGQEKQWPDLVLEIALTSGGVNKLELYRRFEVPEVWIWRRNGLAVFALRTDASGYEQSEKISLFPMLDLELLQRCVTIRSWQEARRTFRAGLRPAP
jgi:Uma2 family endonuclease